MERLLETDSISNDSMATLVGHVGSGEEELMFTGDLAASTQLSLDAFEATSLEPLVQGTQIGFNGTTDSTGLTLGIFGGNALHNLSGKVEELQGANYLVSSKIDLAEGFL